MTGTAALWIAMLILVYVVLALAVVASRGRRVWLALPSVLPVLLLVALPAVGAPDVPGNGLLLGVTIGVALLGIAAGSPLVALVLRIATVGGLSRPGAHGGILVEDSPAGGKGREVLRGGSTIGYLERIAIIGAVLAGQAGALAVIVAVKGLGRFSELDSAEARERFIIGTLASFVWAGACTAAIIFTR